MSAIADRIATRMRLAKTHTAPSTQRILASKYKALAKHFTGNITQHSVDEYIAARLSGGIATSTLNYELACLRTLLTPKDNITIRPVRNREKRERVYLTEDEISGLIKNLPPQMVDMAAAYLYTGCRLEELREVKQEDLTERPGFVRIYNRKTASSGYNHTRYVPLGWDSAKLLPLDKSISASQFRRALAAARVAAGIPITVTPKTLRSTFASNLVQRGVPMETVATLLGHSSTAITQKHYAHLCPKNLQDAISLLPQVSCPDSTADAANTGECQ